ncbi:matrilin-3a isoform X5 [Coregonus clupeaformis]|uniref:matrilin-3a isoform X5 n=1 Tax=Coregonus clupeaformis TaxID=59861 RepID=UPI001BE0D1E7|nr:matrilin-3a isoform X5 [Coregonus clupeaformis]
MKSLFGNLVYCLFLFVSDVYGTYRLNGFDPLQVTAQSYAQRRNLARPPLRTLDPSVHASAYRHRGYHYHHQPPGIHLPVVYHQPVPLSPPVAYHRPSVPLPPYQHRFKGPAPPVVYNLYQDLSPPVVHHHPFKGFFPPVSHHHKFKGPCPQTLPLVQPKPTTVPTTSVVYLPTTVPTLPPVTTLQPVMTTLPLEVTTNPVPPTLPVSTQSGVITTTSVKTGWDPCDMGHDCEDICVSSSSNNSYHCRCREGYLLNTDKKTCSQSQKRVDPCAMGHDCEHICVSGNASYHCTCRKGYILNLDQKTCALKQVKVVVVEDPCKCEARLAFQMQTQAALQEITARLADMTGRVEQIENILGPV